MARLTQPQVQAIASTVGMPNPKLMAAIAMAESGGDTDARGPYGEVGLWQIHQAVHVKAHPTWTVAWLRNPANNAAAAKTILASQGLTAWSVYTSGAYKRYYTDGTGVVNAARDALGAIGSVLGGPTGTVVDAATAPIEAARQVGRVAQAVGKAGNWVANPTNWLRVVYVVGGMGLIGAAVFNVYSSNVAKMGKELLGVGAQVAKTRVAGGAGKARL